MNGESLMPPPRKVAARSHRISQKRKNGPVVTPLCLTTLPGESGNILGEYGDISLRNYTQITTLALLLFSTPFISSVPLFPFLILNSSHFPAFTFPLPRHVTPTRARAANRIHRGSLRNGRRLGEFGCTRAPAAMDQSHYPVQ